MPSTYWNNIPVGSVPAMPYHHYHPRGLKKVIMEMAHSFKHTLVDSVNNISARSLYTCCPSHVTHFCLTHTHTHTR